jgi:hypothetical protein
MSTGALPHGYRWKVIHDPTGFFTGRIFRTDDLPTDHPDENGWPNGIIFEHLVTRTRITVYMGRLIKSTAARRN